MMRLFARMHGLDTPERGEPKSARRSTLVALITSGVVIAHLVALGVGGALLFVRSGEGYSTGETLMLAVLAVIAMTAIGRAYRLRRAQSAAEPRPVDLRSLDDSSVPGRDGRH